jgi:uncharacterized membrane protein YgcG
VAACSAPGKGALIMAISTDMQAPKDISTVSIFVSEGPDVKFDYVGVVTPLGTVSLPSTLALVEPADPSTQIQIRVIGYNGQTAKVLRDIQTTVPHERTALLRVPLDFIDLGSVPTNPPQMLPDMNYPLSTTYSVADGISTFDPDTIASTCDPNLLCKTGGDCMTMVNGICASAVVVSDQLPDYQDSLVFGSGGNPNNPGAGCFDVQGCFASPTLVTGVTFSGTTSAPNNCTFPLPALGGTSAAKDAGAMSDAAVAEDGAAPEADASADAALSGGSSSGGSSSSGSSSSGSSGGSSSGSGDIITDSGEGSGGTGVTCETLNCGAATPVCCVDIETNQTSCQPTDSDCAAVGGQPETSGTDAGGDAATHDAGEPLSVEITLSDTVDAALADGGTFQGDQGSVSDAGTSQGNTGTATGSTTSGSLSSLNFAMVTTNMIGVCNAQGQCFVPVENDPNEGWSVNGNTVTLAAGVCAQLMNNSAQLFMADNPMFPTKTESQPVCEPATLGGDAGPENAGDASAFATPDGSLQGMTPDAGTRSGGGFGGADSSTTTTFDATASSPPQDAGSGTGTTGSAGFPDTGAPGVDAASALTGVASIVAGPITTCAVLVSGNVDCWGLVVGASMPTATPEPLAGLTGISTGAIGGTQSSEFACELENSTPLCEGSNSSGQLGNNGTADSDTPVAVQGITGATSIGAGTAFACALIDGTVECWGDNTYGELGNGMNVSSPTPVSVNGITMATQIAVGSDFACALISGGTVECWGDNTYGVLGNIDGGTSSSTPVVVTGFPDVVPTQIAAGENHVCVLTAQGVYCWGDNTFDQLGMGGAGAGASSSTPVESSALTSTTAVAAGGNETCIILQEGQVACWGSNAEEQLGVASGSMSETQTPVGVTNATAIAVGGEHACALIQGGMVKCWGYNIAGEIGTGSLSPTAVVPPQVVVGAGSGLPASEDAAAAP